MFDAEIAAKLLNRWMVKPPAAPRDAYLDLLREGNLHFTHQLGRVSFGEMPTAHPFELESLVFVDGSRALRIRAQGPAPDWTQWTALEPPVAVPDPVRSPLIDEAQCASEANEL